MEKIFKIAGVQKNLENGFDFFDVKLDSKTIRFFTENKLYEANDGVPPNSIEEVSFVNPEDKGYQYMILDNSKFTEFTNSLKRDDFKNAVEPLMEYLAKNHHPMVKCYVDCSTAELLEGQLVHVNNDFIVD